MDIISAFLPILLFFVSWKFASTFTDTSNKQSPKYYKKIAPTRDAVSFDDIVCPVKHELMEIVECLNGKKCYKSAGARLPHGILLIGAAGTGKTLLARAVADSYDFFRSVPLIKYMIIRDSLKRQLRIREANLPFFHCNASEFIEVYVGRGASRIRDLFETARNNAPSVVFIDELDAIGSRSKRSLLGGGSEYIQTFCIPIGIQRLTINQLLAEMDGFLGHYCDVVVIAATNRYASIDPTLLRSGRFDRHIRLSLPTQSERLEIISLYIRKKGLKLAKKATQMLNELAKRTSGFSGADLENLLNESIFCALRNNEEEISMAHFELEIEKMSANIAMTKQSVDEEVSNGRFSLNRVSDIFYSHHTVM
ncbi:hypothetical protein IE077_004582 [Cardiosporidium cionae]|uniref:AAA+ ATPase domain-containing protein n=1 Tax=Cardiosporidium cionae TaxID=476202 RepID=A0ABQ7JEJ7_9APIC|nr:hypothetical protein IE077_004582 [Cardiosporidium cionae]|eukprot:KAF8822432.1 hypothetical protein IE077_004582 [Cardiosporidium cionae]